MVKPQSLILFRVQILGTYLNDKHSITSLSNLASYTLGPGIVVVALFNNETSILNTFKSANVWHSIYQSNNNTTKVTNNKQSTVHLKLTNICMSRALSLAILNDNHAIFNTTSTTTVTTTTTTATTTTTTS